MKMCDHMEDFEREDLFKKIFHDIRKYCPDLKYGQLISTIAKVAPSYIAAMGERRGCIRKLRYIGSTGWPETPPVADDHEFFKLGQIYASASFNGATYTIEAYGERPIGCAYFEWIKEDLANL